MANKMCGINRDLYWKLVDSLESGVLKGKFGELEIETFTGGKRYVAGRISLLMEIRGFYFADEIVEKSLNKLSGG